MRVPVQFTPKIVSDDRYLELQCESSPGHQGIYSQIALLALDFRLAEIGHDVVGLEPRPTIHEPQA
jgi:hypothetical protein